MSPLALGLLALALQGPGAPSQVPAPAEPEPVHAGHLRAGVHTEEQDGELLVSVHTQDARLGPLLEELALQTGTSFSGLERIPATARVTADLDRRPLRQVVTWVLGSVGLRADRRLDTFTLYVDADTREDLQVQAGAEYLRTLREFPDHPLADRAIFGQGLLEEDRQQPAAARKQYEALVQAYPDSTLADDALKRSAELLMAGREWAPAAERWSQLLRLERKSPHEVEAYEQLALCTAMLGDADRAVHMLDALEQIAPAADEDEHQGRLYVRARAEVGRRQHRRALVSLAEADAYQRTELERKVSYELRSRALAGLEEYAAAARSWLVYCELAEGAELEDGLREAADCALLAGDELATLFIERLAAKRGLTEAVAVEAREARTRLDLVSSKLSEQADVERLARAERLLDAGLDDEAEAVLEALLARIERLQPPERARFVLAYGRALGADSADQAAAFLREQVGALPDAEHRAQVYVLAAELYESEGRMDEAIEALQGRL